MNILSSANGLALTIFFWTLGTIVWDTFNLPAVPIMIQRVQDGGFIDVLR